MWTEASPAGSGCRSSSGLAITGSRTSAVSSDQRTSARRAPALAAGQRRGRSAGRSPLERRPGRRPEPDGADGAGGVAEPSVIGGAGSASGLGQLSRVRRTSQVGVAGEGEVVAGVGDDLDDGPQRGLGTGQPLLGRGPPAGRAGRAPVTGELLLRPREHGGGKSRRAAATRGADGHRPAVARRHPGPAVVTRHGTVDYGAGHVRETRSCATSWPTASPG